jgi:hypothetical protein
MNFNEAQVLKSSTEIESKNKNVMIKYLYLPLHLIQIKIPKLIEAHRGILL